MALGVGHPATYVPMLVWLSSWFLVPECRCVMASHVEWRQRCMLAVPCGPSGDREVANADVQGAPCSIFKGCSFGSTSSAGSGAATSFQLLLQCCLTFPPLLALAPSQGCAGSPIK
mmetsp:Transcript_103270/g.177983  ORF Transcript_103270/g.177983 Transcript_103270/m.177983 type:complete len:116 (-) Transcript_103270:659-1006(-)